MDGRGLNPFGAYSGLRDQLGPAQAVGGGLLGTIGRAQDAGREEWAPERDRWRELLRQRNMGGLETSHALAPAEHGAYAEMRTRERPLLGPVEQLALIPAYEGAKATGLLDLLGLQDDTTSPPSLESMAEGYRGVGRGVASNLRGLLGL